MAGRAPPPRAGRPSPDAGLSAPGRVEGSRDAGLPAMAIGTQPPSPGAPLEPGVPMQPAVTPTLGSPLSAALRRSGPTAR